MLYFVNIRSGKKKMLIIKIVLFKTNAIFPIKRSISLTAVDNSVRKCSQWS